MFCAMAASTSAAMFWRLAVPVWECVVKVLEEGDMVGICGVRGGRDPELDGPVGAGGCCGRGPVRLTGLGCVFSGDWTMLVDCRL